MMVRKVPFVMCLAVFLAGACTGSTEDDSDDNEGTGGTGTGGTGTGGNAGSGGDSSTGGKVGAGGSDNLAGQGNLGGAGAGGTNGTGGSNGIPENAPKGSLLSGAFVPLAAAADEGLADASGVAQLFRTPSGDTVVQIQVLGLAPNREYGAHLHALPCSINAGGGHYKLDPSVTDTRAENEVWPNLETDAKGTGHGRATAKGHVARGEAQAVVVHDMDGTKLLCANLNDGSENVLFAGTFSDFAAATDAEQDITGTLDAELSSGGTDFSLMLSGLDPEESYAAHVHALPCEVLSAGGHYKLDPTIEATEAENELWPPVDVETSGGVVSSLDSPHQIRTDAQSVVVHKNGDKVLCADLERTTPWPDIETDGVAMLFDEALEEHWEELTAEATMTRYTSGYTRVAIAVAGVPPHTDLGIHVHNRPCTVEEGGGHYKLDESVEEALEDNEIWLNLTVEDDGSASRSTTIKHLARPEAQSIVLHADDGLRLACIDLG